MTAMTTPNIMHNNNNIQPSTRKVRRRRLPCTRRHARDSSANSWRSALALSTMSLLLALSHDQHVHVTDAFAPTLSATAAAAVTETQTQTSISFRNVDTDDDSVHTGSSILRGTGSDTTSSSSSSTLTSTSRSKSRQMSITNTASHLESLFSNTNAAATNIHNSKSGSASPTITTHFHHNHNYNYNHNDNNNSATYKDRMPSWLRPQGYIAEEAIAVLRQIMRESSHLSRLEAEKVVAAIQEASHGDPDQMAGAAEFCHMLVETMEMAASVETLIAAAFHYCECYVARVHESQAEAQQQQQKQTQTHHSGFSHLMYWDFNSFSPSYMHSHNHDHHPSDVSNYLNSRAIKIGHDAHQLVQAAARIKRAEMMVSQSVYRHDARPTNDEAAGMRKMLLSETMDWRALAIRSAACLYRLRGIHRFYDNRDDDNGNGNANRKRNRNASPQEIRVAREALCIHAPLASRLGMHRLKNEIEGAAFSILYPRQHAKVTNMTQQNKPCNNVEEEECIVSTLRDGMRLILDQVTRKVENLLETDRYFSKYVDSDSVKVTARIKEPYSLWRKMLKLGAENILDVPDALALRVVFDAKKLTPEEDDDVTSARERALCYYVQKSCVNMFQPVKERNGRFKDYIARPKPNGYQSLHYTAFTTFDGEEWPFEIQVRSGEMHQVAEFGLAAHWDYKAQDKTEKASGSSSSSSSLKNSSDAYLRSVQEWHWQQSHARASWVTESSMEGGISSACANENLTPYLETLMRDRSNLAREHVFVFLSCSSSNDSSSTGSTSACNSSNSQILELPAGACVLDAVRESERSFGYNSRHLLDDEIAHNGSPTSMTRQLCNGDIVTIPMVTATAGARRTSSAVSP